MGKNAAVVAQMNDATAGDLDEDPVVLGKGPRMNRSGASPDVPVGRAEAPLSIVDVGLEIEVQPLETIQNNTTGVEEICVTDNFLVVRRRPKPELFLEYALYDANGKQINSEQNIPNFGIYGGDIARVVQGLNASHIKWGTFRSDYSRAASIDDVMKSLNIAPERRESLVAILQKYTANPYLSLDELTKIKNVIVPHSVRIVSDSASGRVIFQSEKQLQIFQTIAEDGEVLAPDSWERSEIPDITKITSLQLKKSPVLREFIESGRGEQLKGSDRAVNLERGILNVVETGTGTRVFTTGASAYAVDPADGKTIYYIDPSGKEVKWFDGKSVAGGKVKSESHALSLPGKVTSLDLDPQGNFLLVGVDQGAAKKVLVYAKDSLIPVGQIDDVCSRIAMDRLGTLYFVDSSKRVRLATTNFMSFPAGGLEELRRQETEKLSRIGSKVTHLSLAEIPDAEAAKRKPSTPEEMLKGLAEQIAAQFGPELDAARTVKQMEKLEKKVDTLKASDDFKDHPQIFDEFLRKIDEKVRSVKISGLTSGLDKFEKLLGDADTAEKVLELQDMLTAYLQDRRSVFISDAAMRKSIDGRLTDFGEKLKKKSVSLQKELVGELSEKLNEVKKAIAETGSDEELRAIMAHPATVEFQALRRLIIDPEASKEWLENYREAVRDQKNLIAERITQEKEASLRRSALQLGEARETFSEIAEGMQSEVTDVKDLDRWARDNPAVTTFRAQLLELPDNVREREEERLSALIATRRQVLEQKAKMSVSRENGQVKFSGDTFPVFQPTIEETKDRRVPEYREKWVINKFNEPLLGRIARQSTIQIERHRGILIIEGEAGTGKNMLIDMFAHFTNRSVYTFAANFQTEKEDLSYDFGFDPAKGTFRVDSRFIKMLQTPGAIICIDEINTLPPGLTKMLNSLLDYRRELYLPDGRVIKVDPSVILMGTMNPQGYVGVQELPQEVISRATIMHVDYPPEKDSKGKYTPYEAEIMAKEVDCLKALTQSEFYTLWDYVINGASTNGGDKISSDDKVLAVKNIHQVVKTANRVREAYKAFHMRTSNEMIEFIFSLRECENIATELNYDGDVKTAIKGVVLPKIGDPVGQEKVKTIIENV